MAETALILSFARQVTFSKSAIFHREDIRKTGNAAHTHGVEWCTGPGTWAGQGTAR